MIPIYLLSASEPFRLDYLVVAGGAGGGREGGGGGAGGYLCSVPGEQSGGPSTRLETIQFIGGQTLSLTVGAGGAYRNNGSNSQFGPLVSIGGGKGGDGDGSDGGSGGGGGALPIALGQGGIATTNQGNNGGAMVTFGANYPATYVYGGGGGASEVGNTDGSAQGGDGIASSITGISVLRAGGGAGASAFSSQPGGDGGGGNGASGDLRDSSGTPAQSGTVNTGGGGGGGYDAIGGGGGGGSGLIVLRYPSLARIIDFVSPGLTYNYSDDGTFKRYVFTAGTGSIRF